jgi:WD40 repeat protein
VPLWRLASGLRCITALALEPTDARLLAAASPHGEVLFWDVGQPFTEPVAALAAHVHSITSVAFSGDGCLFATASQDKTLRVWALIRTSDAPSTLTQSSKANPVPSPPTPRSALTRGESGLCNAHDGESPRARDASTQMRLRVLHRLVGHSEAVTAMAFVPVGSNGAVGEQGLHRSSDALGRLDAAHLLASTSIDGSVRLWNLTTGQPLLPVLRPLGRACSVGCVAFAPDAQQVAAGCDDGTVRVWSLKHMGLKQSSSKTSELRVQEKLVLRAKSAIDVLVDSLKTLSPDSLDHLRNLSLPASAGMRAGDPCSSGRAGAWQVPEAQRTQCVDGHRLPLSSLFYTRSGTLLVSACAGGQVKIWSAAEGALLRTIIRSPQGVAVGCVALATEPMVWAACSDGMLRGARIPELEAEALVAAARTVLEAVPLPQDEAPGNEPKNTDAKKRRVKKKIKMMQELEEEEALELERKEDAAVLAAALARREGVEGVAREDGVRQVSLSSERRFGAGLRLVVCSAAASCISCIQKKSMPCTN